MKIENSRNSLEKSSNTKFNENPSSDSRIVSGGRTDRQRDMTKLKVAFPNFVKAPKKINLKMSPLFLVDYVGNLL